MAMKANVFKITSWFAISLKLKAAYEQATVNKSAKKSAEICLPTYLEWPIYCCRILIEIGVFLKQFLAIRGV